MPPNAALDDPPTIGDERLDSVIRAHRDHLAQRGSLIIGSGRSRCNKFDIALHTDFGPLKQDKGTNQDYALVWQPSGAESGDRLQFALAMSDGLTSSFWSERAAVLACWVAMGVLVDRKASLAPEELARSAFDAAGRAIGQFVDDLRRDPEAARPGDQPYASTWKFMLDRGRLMQTTLMLAWVARGYFHLAIVGDGGALWRDYGTTASGREGTDRILAQCDPETQQVQALGPDSPRVVAWDRWVRVPITGPFLCALFTDGIGRGLGDAPSRLLDDLERSHGDEAGNPSRQFIGRAIAERPADFDDNLTLASFRLG